LAKKVHVVFFTLSRAVELKKVWSAMYFLSLPLKSLTCLNFSDIPFFNSGLVNMLKFSQIILPYVKMGSILTGTNRY